MQCPRCQSQNYIKDGIVKSKQRYKCKECNFRYTVLNQSTEKPFYLKRLAFQLYLESLGFCSIGRILSISNVSILKWIEKFGEQVENLQQTEPSKMIEIDEMHTYYSFLYILAALLRDIPVWSSI